MTAPDHLRITGPEDILGFIPHSLGYWPQNSLVAMTLQGKRLGATLRIDLPGPGGGSGRTVGGTAGFAGFARTVASYLEADDAADGSLLAFFTGGDGDSDGGDIDGTGDGALWARLLTELELALEEAGMPLRDAWIIGAEYWRNAYCSDPACCAPPGRPVDEIRNSRLNAEMVFRGSRVGAAPGAPAAELPLRRPDPATLEAELGWSQEFSGRRRDRAQFGQVLDVWMRVLRAASSPGAPPGLPPDRTPDLSPGLAGYLRASLCVQAWRDAVLVMAAAGRAAAERGAEEFAVFDTRTLTRPPGTQPPAAPPPAPMPMLEGFPAEEPPGPAPGPVGGPHEAPGYGDVLLGLAPSVPDWALMVKLERVLVQLGGDGGAEARAASLTARGWIEWCRGRGSFADALFRQAVHEYPGYRLAELLAELARRGTLCGWAARREAAWQKFAPDAA
ncbi:DUF4192 family protein [Pseudarthrobacter sp. S9]|uniref:DUF4192 family protein n=1 Tax=Pseudarthrobacter sp. S9 TaxID=3418421 RepID=UPI003D009D52